MICIGIDPGLTGAIAVVSRQGLIALCDLPTMERSPGGFVKTQVNPAALAAMIREWLADHDKNEFEVMLEMAGAMPGQGLVSTLSIGMTAGIIEGVVATMGLRHHLTKPSDWKKAMKLNSDKEACRAAAQRLYPDAPIGLKKHHNRAEALLLAHYGFQKFH